MSDRDWPQEQCVSVRFPPLSGIIISGCARLGLCNAGLERRELAPGKASMSNSILTRVAAKTAAEICQHCPLGEAAQKLLRSNLTPSQYLNALTEQQLDVDAIRFLAYALPKREAVWWACVCVRKAQGGTLSSAAATALQAAEKWAADPSEDHRRAAMAASQAAGLAEPAGCAAAAAFWSGGSLAPPNLPVVPPGEHLTAHGVASAVLLAAVLTEPARAPEKQRAFVKLGLDVASGANRWKELSR